jgi:hypothetical protein
VAVAAVTAIIGGVLQEVQVAVVQIPVIQELVVMSLMD